MLPLTAAHSQDARCALATARARPAASCSSLRDLSLNKGNGYCWQESWR